MVMTTSLDSYVKAFAPVIPVIQQAIAAFESEESARLKALREEAMAEHEADCIPAQLTAQASEFERSTAMFAAALICAAQPDRSFDDVRKQATGLAAAMRDHFFPARPYPPTTPAPPPAPDAEFEPTASAPATT